MTYSIVARDPASGQLGVAVQSHYLGVGPIVPWGRAGVGAVATQAMVLLDHGPRVLANLTDGQDAPSALAASLALDPQREVRQVAAVDASGAAAAHTGDRCIPHAAHLVGEGFSVQANMMADPGVPDAMAAAYVGAPGDLGARLLAALDAAQAAGGDIRGQQSAALLTVAAERHPEAWQGRLLDVRVEDHPAPLTELRRLVALKQAYARVDEADELLAAGDVGAAFTAYQQGLAAAPGNIELRFWAAVSAYDAGHHERGRQEFAQVVRVDPAWAELLRRLATVDLFAGDVSDALRDV